jgi:TRAP-type mannitol/chloroaromatic compound transport system permease small subunit
MHGVVFMMGIPYALKENRHVRVDLIYARLSEHARTRINMIGHVLCLIPVCVLILYFAIPYVFASWRVLESSPEVGGIPAVFLLKTLIPIAAVALLLQGVAEIARGALKIRGHITEVDG